MFTQSIKPEQKQYAWKLVNESNMANRGRFDGDKEKQYTGMLGEVCFADGMGQPRPRPGNGPDNGIDFIIKGIKIDIKTMGRTSYPTLKFVNNLVMEQTAYQTDLYVFASIHKKTGKITFCGCLPKDDLQKSWIHTRGKVRTRADGTEFALHIDTYEIQNRELGSVKTWNCINTHILWETV